MKAPIRRWILTLFLVLVAPAQAETPMLSQARSTAYVSDSVDVPLRAVCLLYTSQAQMRQTLNGFSAQIDWQQGRIVRQILGEQFQQRFADMATAERHPWVSRVIGACAAWQRDALLKHCLLYTSRCV